METLTEAPMSLGERFRAAREQRGLTLSDVSEHLHIRSVYLAAIEDENWAAAPAPVYTRGFLRTYARFLGLDPEQAVAEFNAVSASGADETPAVSSYRPPRSMRPLLLLGSFIAVLLIAWVVYLYSTPASTHRPAVAASGTAVPASPAGFPQASAAPSAIPTAAAPTLALRFTQPSWVRVSVDGNVSIEGTFPAGTTRTFRGKTILVRAGNAAGVEVALDGKPFDKLGGPGDVVEKRFHL
jgi:cytoskeleton protein RodZ